MKKYEISELLFRPAPVFCLFFFLAVFLSSFAHSAQAAAPLDNIYDSGVSERDPAPEDKGLNSLPLQLRAENKALNDTLDSVKKISPDVYKLGTTPLADHLSTSIRPSLSSVCKTGTRWICFKNVPTVEGNGIETAIFGVCTDPGEDSGAECSRVY